jgi:protein-tyrosine phosphatase
MVDVHCHILPGLDDGPGDMEISLAMAESAIADGITHVVATPHSSNEYSFDYARVRELRQELQGRIGGRLTLATGCDFHLNPENLEALRVDAPRFCINQRDYLLVEFNEYSIPPAMDQTLHEIQLLGLRPVITHPERNAILRLQTERLRKWVRLGCFVQVTAGSLTGIFGPGAEKNAWRWMADGVVTLWPAMLTIPVGGPSNSSLHSTLFGSSWEKQKPLLFLSKIRWPPSRDVTCRMSLNWRMKPISLAASGFSFSKSLVRGAQRHSGPGIQDAQ